MKKIALGILLLCVAALQLPAQSRVTVNGTAALSTSYLWRGDRVTGLHAAPDIQFHIGNLTLENYSFLALDGSYKEIDLDVSYTIGDFTVHAADYFYRYSSYTFPENYFSWSKYDTTHIDELALVYESSAIPLIAKWFTFVWGDWIPNADGSRGKPSFSSYLELAAWHEFGNVCRGSLIAGASVFKGSYTNYTQNFMPIHLEARLNKSFELGAVKFPVSFSFVVNPYTLTCWTALSAGVSF